MKLKFLSSLAAITCTVLLTPLSAHADSIVLSAHSDGSYTYDLLVTDPLSSFPAMDDVSVTGLSGVTSITLSQAVAGYASGSFTDSSATFTSYPAIGVYGPYDVTLFTITSTADNSAGAQYSFTEQVNGSPVLMQGTVADVSTSAVAEPASLLLLGTGLCALMLIVRMKHQTPERLVGPRVAS